MPFSNFISMPTFSSKFDRIGALSKLCCASSSGEVVDSPEATVGALSEDSTDISYDLFCSSWDSYGVNGGLHAPERAKSKFQLRRS